MTEQDIINLKVFIEVGAKALSQDKPLKESLVIQSTAVQLLDKLEALRIPTVDDYPEAEAN
jgi:hypothetical protein